ncbi:ketopantoate reductase family protein [Acidipila sp. EB88]|uniref:ketopantoate reductase family protein n=1 Tax=Acidipila sp. EB88 TaxID=2305226 RepID=UPI000F5D75E8|nr:ketopantoate reductase family protein [Acidipila sp. EB88]RRA48478.1 ketopantoate reductase family protein [Acidipila sp. EB88]
MQPRLLMVGAGATGGLFGGRLAEAGRDITFLVRGQRAEQLRRDGLCIRSPHGDARVKPQLIAAEQLRAEPDGGFDVVLVSTKAYSLDAAMEDFAPAVGEQTLIVPMLNGMRHLDALRARFGVGRVLGGTCRVVADLDAEGYVEQRTTLGELCFGALPGWEQGAAERTRLEWIAEELTVPGFVLKHVDDVLAAMWQKWWILASLGTICVLARGSVGDAAAVPYGPETARAIVQECVQIAAANGYPADAAMLGGHMQRVCEVGSALTSSMYRDMTKGAPVEADPILGDLLERAGAVEAPLVRAAFVQLKVYEAQRGAR